MDVIGWTNAVTGALAEGVAVTEVTNCGCVVGLNIGGTVVRHGGLGWYSAAKVAEAIAAAR